MNSRATLGLLVLLTVGAPIPALADPVAILAFRSEPGDYVGGGQTVRVVYRAPLDTMYASVSSLPDGRPAGLSFILFGRFPDYHFATLAFGTNQLGIPLEPGTYTNAERAPFASPGHPGLDVTFAGSGSNTLTGSFTVSEISFFRDSFRMLQIDRFKARFEQHSEGRPPAMFGSFVYDASPVPEPGALLLVGTGVLGLWSRRRRLVRAEFQ